VFILGQDVLLETRVLQRASSCRTACWEKAVLEESLEVFIRGEAVRGQPEGAFPAKSEHRSSLQKNNQP
jgi:hypothetical protein